MSDGAVANLVTGMVTITTIVVGFLTIWIKLKYGAEKTDAVAAKVDNNTEITKAGIKEAGTHAAIAADAAKDAADAAVQAATKTDALAEQLNGKMEAKIRDIVKEHVDTVVAMLNAHTVQDDKNMAEIRQALGELRDRTK